MSAEENDQNENSFEVKCGIVIAIFAAVMSISDIYAGKYGQDQARTINDKSAAYSWYQAKSIRAAMAEGQRDLILAMQNSDASVRGPASAQVEEHIKQLDAKVARYEKQKNEILLGSGAIKKEDWAQDVDGKMGQVVGAKDYERELEVYSAISDNFDLAALFFQICVVLGAVALVMKNQSLRQKFFYAMVCLGIVGTVFSSFAMMAAQKLTL